MNLYDFAPVKAHDGKGTKEDPAVPAAVRLGEQLRVLGEVRSEAVQRAEVEEFDQVTARIRERHAKARADCLIRHGALPTALRSPKGQEDVLTLASDSPRIELSDVRQLADKLGFVAVPWEYLDGRSFEKESWEMKGAIQGFEKMLSPSFHVYVLCPVRHYSVKEHVEAEEDLPIYAGPTSVQAFMAINMSIPMFRELSNRADEADRRQSRTESRVTSAEKGIRDLAARVEQLAQAVERQQQAALLARAEAEEAKRLRAVTAFVPWEPMMFAFPKGMDVLSGEWPAVVGPCWGPDFEDVVVEACGMSKVQGQRARLSKLLPPWQAGGGGRRGW